MMRAPTPALWAAATVMTLTVLCSMWCAPGAHAQEVIAVDFGLIPADAVNTASQVPRGCTCQSSSSTCTEFDCTCVCDLTAGACDANCCCDSECTAAEISRFEAADACLDEGPLPSTTTYCADLTKEALFGSINPKFRMIKSEQDSVVDDLMCVAVDNNPSKGSFYEDPGTGSVSLLDSTTKPASFATSARVASVSTATLYEVGENVGAATTTVGDALVATGGGKFLLPQAGGSGSCFDANTVPFAQDVPSSSCVRVLSGTSADRCASLDVSDFLTNLRIAKAPNSQISDVSTYVTVTTATVKYRFLNGSMINHPNPAALVPSAVVDACSNALLQIDYTLTEDGAGHVSGASANVILGDASMAGTFVTVPQTYSVTWASSASVTRSYALGNAVARDMSGNPGYIPGKPVLAGTKQTEGGTSKEAIEMWVDGLGLKQCTGTDLTYVTYGDSMTFGCSLTLSLAQLEAMCTSKSQLAMFGTTATHVGAFGNADPLRTAEWVEIVSEAPASLSTVWQSSSRSCSGVAAGLNVEFLTAPVGEEGNPQNKILVARVAYARDTWTYTSRTGTQTFVLTTSVSFVPKGTTEVTEYIPPPPPVLPTLPNDLFYPFDLGIDMSTNSASNARASSILLLIVAAVASAATLAVL